MDVLLEERAPPVVSAEVERDLAGALALREPRRLDVREVVEVEARGREHAQIGVGPLVLLDPLLEERVPRLERPGDEGREPAVEILKIADRVEVVEEVVGALDVAVHHRRRGLEPAPVRLAVGLEPGAGTALLGLDPPAHALREDLGPAAGERPLTGLPEPVEHLADAEAAHLRDGLDLGGGEEVRRHAGEAAARLAHEGRVVVERQRRVVAALEEHRRRALLGRELDLGEHLLDAERVGLGITGLAVEGAELAVGDADVGVVRVRVDDEGDGAVRDPREPDLLGERAQLEERRVREEPAALVAIEALAVERLLANAFRGIRR